MDDTGPVVSLLPPDMRQYAGNLADAEEIRLRTGRLPACLSHGTEQPIPGSRSVTAADLEGVLERATGASVHSAQASVRNGFVSVRGGVRLGLCGTVITKADRPEGIRKLSSVSIRIPREVRGCCSGIYGRLTAAGFQNTLVLSPPGGGKTTCLRELVRLLSDSGLRVSLCDDRGEIAAVWNGNPQFDVGRCTDVMSDAPKAETAIMLLRAMNPQILAMDEITAPGDVLAVEEAVGCGVRLLASAHAGSVDEFCSRPLYRRLLEGGVFKNAVVIKNTDGERRYALEAMP